VLIILLIPFRILVIPRWFSLEDLEVLDDFTATNKIVLASLGGKPSLPELTKVEDWGLERRRSERIHGVARQRAGSLHR
jgi:boron transporter